MVRMDDTKKKKGALDEDELIDPAVLDAVTDDVAEDEAGEWVDGKADAEEEY